MTTFHRPGSWDEALTIKRDDPDALPIQGGTDVMVGMNFGRLSPPALLDLSRLTDLRGWEAKDGAVSIGAGVTYTQIINELTDLAPGLAAAARTVGSPQIRNRGTLGGNLGTSSPAGDAHPPLLATNATVEVVSLARGSRRIPMAEFFLGPKRNALAPDELISSVEVPVTKGVQQFAKIGTRNAMVIAVASFAISLEPQRVGTGIGSAGPTPLTAPRAEELLLNELPSFSSKGDLPDSLVSRFGALVSGAASPIDDTRASARYRRHALSVLASRCLAWAWKQLSSEVTT